MATKKIVFAPNLCVYRKNLLINSDIYQEVFGWFSAYFMAPFPHLMNLQTPDQGKTSLAVTKYCVPLRLHRQSNIRIADSS
jgi:hypothetical protein